MAATWPPSKPLEAETNICNPVQAEHVTLNDFVLLSY